MFLQDFCHSHLILLLEGSNYLYPTTMLVLPNDHQSSQIGASKWHKLYYTNMNKIAGLLWKSEQSIAADINSFSYIDCCNKEANLLITRCFTALDLFIA